MSLVMKRLQVIHARLISTQKKHMGQIIAYVDLVSIPGDIERTHLYIRHFIFPNLGRKGANFV